MWIVVAIIAYFLLALAALIDKYLLAGPIPNPKFYTFAIGMFGSVVFLLIPFGVFAVPAVSVLLLGFLGGACNLFALLTFFTGLQKFEASRIVPAIGGITPLFTALLTVGFAPEAHVFVGVDFLAFLLLVVGTVGISMQRQTSLTVESLFYAVLAAFFFAASVVFAKFIYVSLPFLSAVVWVMLGTFTTALLFLLFREVRTEIVVFFRKKQKTPGKLFLSWTAFLFWLNRILGGSAVALQHFAVFLAPFGAIAFVHAMAGFQYMFLFLLAIALSWKAPRVFDEKLTGSVLVQKIASALLIGGGLALLAF